LSTIVRFLQPKFRAFQQLLPTDLALDACLSHAVRTQGSAAGLLIFAEEKLLFHGHNNGINLPRSFVTAIW
jgi:hypothetical protein